MTYKYVPKLLSTKVQTNLPQTAHKSCIISDYNFLNCTAELIETKSRRSVTQFKTRWYLLKWVYLSTLKTVKKLPSSRETLNGVIKSRSAQTVHSYKKSETKNSNNN